MQKYAAPFSIKPEAYFLLNKFLICCCLWLFSNQSRAADEDSLKLRKQILIGTNVAAYSGAMTGLYHLWYKDYPMGKFQFFNDNAEWLQMDKLGHAYSCYYEGRTGIQMMRWAGYSEKTSIWLGGSYGWLIQAGVEVLDGFSQGWGASLGDLAANSAGSALVIGQELTWKEQRITMKVSYTPSPYAQYRPNVLGSSHIERLFKDYNGQIYWLSSSPACWMKSSTQFPKWIGFAVGYGADGMTGGFENIQIEQNGQMTDPFIRHRQFYLAPDIDLSRIPVKKKWQKSCLLVLNCLKFPLPGISFDNTNKLKMHWVAY